MEIAAPEVASASPTCDPAVDREAPAPDAGSMSEVDSVAVSILLVEDNPATRFATTMLLKSCQGKQGGPAEIGVIPAENGRQALELLEHRRREISIVMLDLNLPDCDGVQLLRQIRRQAPEIRLIVTTGMPEFELAARFASGNDEQVDAQIDGQDGQIDAQIDGLPGGQIAHRVLAKPFDGDVLIEAIQGVLAASSRA